MDIKNLASHFPAHVKTVAFFVLPLAMAFIIFNIVVHAADSDCTNLCDNERVDNVLKWTCSEGGFSETDTIRSRACDKLKADLSKAETAAPASTAVTAKSTVDLITEVNKEVYKDELAEARSQFAGSSSSAAGGASVADSQSGAGSGCYDMIGRSCVDVCREADTDCGQKRCVCDANGFLTGEEMYCKGASHRWTLRQSSDCTADQNLDQVSGGNPAASGSPSSTANSSAANIQCSGACDNRAGHTCGWQVSTQRHCYCDPNDKSKGENGTFHLDTDLTKYCTYCAWDSAACNCLYTFADGTTKKTLAFGAAVCEESGKSQNFSMVCKGGEIEGGDGCLNQVCNSSNPLCYNDGNTETCNKLDEAIIAVAGGKDYITSSCSEKEIEKREKFKADNSYCADSEVLRDQMNIVIGKGIFSSVLNNASAINNLAQGDAKKIACSNTNLTSCEKSDDKTNEYQCVNSGGCRLWNWVTGGGKLCSVKNPDTGTNCTSVKDGGDKCYKYIELVAGNNCVGIGKNEGKTTLSGEYSCGGKPETADKSYLCANGEFTESENCASKGGCEPATGKCRGDYSEQCKAGTFPCDKNEECDACGSDYECKISSSSGGSASGYTNAYNDADYTAGGKKGVCRKKDGITGECSFSVDAGTPSASSSKCKTGSSYGVYVPFTVDTEGECSGINCTVANDFDNTSVTATQSGGSSWYACAKPQSSSSSSDGSKGDNPSRLNFTISCTDGKKTSQDTASCAFPTADDNKFKQAEEDEQASTTEDKANEEEQKKQDGTAPKVTVNSPKDTISTKTAELNVTTDIGATCKYMDSKNGSFSASNFSGNGMAMSGSGGTTHTVTLGNLTEGTADDCKYNHTIVVLCKNSKASSNATSGAIGSGQTSFTVDLSKNAENAPKVANGMSSGKITIANPILKVSTDRPADCEYKEGGSFTFSSGKKFDSTGNYNHTAQLSGLTGKDYDYYVICKDKETCAKSSADFKVEFTVDLALDPANAPKITATTPATQTVANPTLSITTEKAATCQYKKDATFTYGDSSATQFTTDGDLGHTVLLTAWPDGKYTFYVACKDKATGAVKTLEQAIVTTLDRGQGAPTIVSVTPEIQTVDNPALSVTTDIPATCQYKKDATFTYGSGTALESADGYSHKISIAGLADGTHTFYVACKSKDASGTAKTMGNPIVTKLSRTGTVPVITNTTAGNQTTNSPTLSVNTSAAATCQYKEGGDFTYGGGTQFITDGSTNHSAQLANIANGQHTYYVVCKDTASGNTNPSGAQIVFTVNTTTGAPVISNTTPNNQSAGAVTLLITTSAAATCQYKEGGEFTYGGGIQFTTDGGTGHSAVLGNLGDGAHTFYVVCKDTATGATNGSPAQVIFTVTSAATCADLSTNDKQNDNDRNVDNEDESDSDYLWRSLEAGTRDKFTKVDWYAGYQFTTEKDGQVTQLCGYFDDGSSNKVSLYGASYAELASVQISGTGDWKCASISPVPVKTDKRYYVIARVKDGPIYYEYKSGLLPRDNDNATVEAGIRQLAGEKFGKDIKKYDYMVFGLVDAKIKFTSESNKGPEVDTAIPVGTISGNDTMISVATDIEATCKFSREDVEYADMKYSFAKTGNKTHEQKVCSLDDGPFTFYIRCKGETGTNDASTLIQFEVSD
ncbi:MAG: hypothetical protein L7H18_00945 [Candidatus Nealsonbacteria bacterium DGGOD1a]|nr:MAG: hypothetical protein L7H18_00945 [Candidatus Nealsonbacteria bacterium DGGOD1a]